MRKENHKNSLQLAMEHGGVQGEHPDYPIKDWQYEVANNDTRLGYWAWVSSKLND